MTGEIAAGRGTGTAALQLRQPAGGGVAVCGHGVGQKRLDAAYIFISH